MLDVFLDVIAPVLVMAALGGLVGRRFDVPVEVLSNLVFNLFAPALVFRTLSTVELSGDTARIAGTTLLVLAASAVLSLMASWARRHDAPTRATLALGSSVSNGGNMGLPVALLAFGQVGLDVAVLAFVVGGIWANSAGVMLASMAGGSTKGALRAPLTAPALWAASTALIVNALDVEIPTVVSASASTLGDASIPLMLVVLGLQLRPDIGGEGMADLVQIAIIRLLIGPVLALGAVELLGVHGASHDTLIVLGAMPTAVFTVVLATQYGARPTLVSRAVILTTVLSIATLTVLISIVR